MAPKPDIDSANDVDWEQAAKREVVIAGLTSKARVSNREVESAAETLGLSRAMTENDRDEQEKRIKYNDLIANAAILQNVIDVVRMLRELEGEGRPVSKERSLLTCALLDPINQTVR